MRMKKKGYLSFADHPSRAFFIRVIPVEIAAELSKMMEDETKQRWLAMPERRLRAELRGRGHQIDPKDMILRVRFWFEFDRLCSFKGARQKQHPSMSLDYILGW